MDPVEFGNINWDSWPLVTISMQRPPTQDIEIDLFEEKFIKLLTLARDGCPEAGVDPAKLLILFSMDGIIDATFDQKRRAARIITTVRPFAEVCIARTALVTTNRLANLVLSAVLAIAPLVSVNKMFGNEQEARAWLNSKSKP